ncbi:MAG TPA: hypothetical protein PKU86_03565, partial [Bacteroidales bacterium]|nr:hypothetical protein [Bacteroidales bacterium]
MKTKGRELLDKIFLRSFITAIYFVLSLFSLGLQAQCPPGIKPIKPDPTSQAITNENDATFCVGDSVWLVDTTPAAASGYSWYRNDSIIPEETRDTLTA